MTNPNNRYGGTLGVKSNNVVFDMTLYNGHIARCMQLIRPFAFVFFTSLICLILQRCSLM